MQRLAHREEVSPLFIEALDRAGVARERRERIVDQIVLTGTCQGVDELPHELQHTFVVSQDITADQHVLMQAALQCYVDNSISKTINCPPGATPADIKQVAGRLTVIQKLWRKHRDELRGRLRTAAATPAGDEKPAAADDLRERALDDDEPLGHEEIPIARDDGKVQFNSDTVSTSEEGP